MSDVVTDSPARNSGREAAICRAALELLAEVGYDRMSMDAVANRARASKATIYRHWPGKYELVLDALRSRGVSEIAPIDTGSLRGDLLAVLHAIADGIAGEDIELMAGAVRAMRAAPELANCVRDSLIEDKRDVARVIVDRAIRRRELPAHADPELLHQVAPAMILFQLLICAQPADDPYLEHVVDDVLTPLLTQPRTTPSEPEGLLA
ncbi:MAG: TetR/AcrR family transcriptional regulator [Propionibacteriaceae bacterium]